MLKLSKRELFKGLFVGFLSSPLLAKMGWRPVVPPVKVKTSGVRLFINGNELPEVVSLSGPSYESTYYDQDEVGITTLDSKPLAGLPDFIETVTFDRALLADERLALRILKTTCWIKPGHWNSY